MLAGEIAQDDVGSGGAQHLPGLLAKRGQVSGLQRRRGCERREGGEDILDLAVDVHSHVRRHFAHALFQPRPLAPLELNEQQARENEDRHNDR